MWKRYGNIWVCQEMTFLTIEPFVAEGQPDGPRVWKACCGGRPVPQIEPSTSSTEVMMRAEKYYDARIKMPYAGQRWR